MRRMPQLTPGATSVQMTSAWRGYNHNEIIGDGEMYDMQNLSGDNYPVLSLRQKRGITSLDVSGQPSVPLTGIHGRDQLVYIRGTKAYYNGLRKELLEKTDALYTKLSEAVSKKAAKAEEAPKAEKPAAKKAPAKKAEPKAEEAPAKKAPAKKAEPKAEKPAAEKKPAAKKPAAKKAAPKAE